MNLWLKHLNGLPVSKGVGAKGKYTDDDVRDFVAASKYWSTAPLLETPSFIKSKPKADIPAKQKIIAEYPKAAQVYGAISNRDLDWSFIDPDGA